MDRILKNGIVFLSVAAALLTLSGCDSGKAKAQTSQAASVRAANIVTITLHKFEDTVSLPGRVEPIRSAEVRARVEGIVLRKTFTEGADVKAGDVLFEIDPASLKIALEHAKGELAMAEATRFDAKNLVDRYTSLLKSQAVSKQKYDAALAAYKRAQASVQSAQADVESAKLNLGYATVRAPISGRIGRADVSEGMLVGQNGATLMATIQQLDPVYVDFNQPVTDTLKYRAAMEHDPANSETKLTVALDGYDKDFPGKLLFSASKVDEKTGNVVLRGLFANPQKILLPGMYVQVTATQSRTLDAILIPQRAVMRNEDGHAFVYVVDDGGKVESRMVDTGAMNGVFWRITKGLQPGDKVIIDNAMTFSVGEKVVPEKKLASNA